MSAVTHLTQHLLRLDPQKSIPRQTLHNYLKIFVDGDAALTAEHLSEFFAYVLNYQYWQTHAKTLGESLHQDILKWAESQKLEFDLQAVNFPHWTQMVAIEHSGDFEKLLEKREEERSEEGDRRKLLPLSETQHLVAILKRNSSLHVRVYNRLARILGGELHALRPVSDLKYSADLELLQFEPFLLECPMVTAGKFQVTTDGIQGTLVRGHSLQRFETLTMGPIQNHAEVFYGLKRLERHFINPQSDPYYRDMATQLERVYQLLSQGSPDGRRMATSVLQRARAAQKNIFPNDKLLQTLISNVEFALMGSAVEPRATL